MTSEPASAAKKEYKTPKNWRDDWHGPKLFLPSEIDTSVEYRCNTATRRYWSVNPRSLWAWHNSGLDVTLRYDRDLFLEEIVVAKDQPEFFENCKERGFEPEQTLKVLLHEASLRYVCWGPTRRIFPEALYCDSDGSEQQKQAQASGTSTTG
jgi:hypothetical protein